MTWIKGGPFYELSLLLSNSMSKTETVNSILNTINKLDFILEFQNNTSELVLKQRKFIEFEESDNNEVNTINLDFQLFLEKRRKGRLLVLELSNDLLKLDFVFYGGKFDAQEMNLKGLSVEVKESLNLFFEDCFLKYDPIMGSVGYEVDVLEFINTDKIYPDKSYNIGNLDIKQMKTKFECSDEFEIAYVNTKYLNGSEAEILKLRK